MCAWLRRVQEAQDEMASIKAATSVCSALVQHLFGSSSSRGARRGAGQAILEAGVCGRTTMLKLVPKYPVCGHVVRFNHALLVARFNHALLVVASRDFTVVKLQSL